MSDIVLTDANFEAEVLKNDKPVLVDFWATWCVPCKIQGPIIEEIAGEMTGKVKVGKMDVDANLAISQQFGIMSIPTIMIFNGGQPVKQWIGVQSKQTIMGELNSLLN
jgi:thioredoxin 1